MSTVLDLKQLKLTKSEVIYGVSWEIYESLIKKYWGEKSPRLTYDSGILEVEVSNSAYHEENTYILTKLVDIIAEELNLALRNFGSATHRKKSLRKGFEPDSCFYIQSLQLIEGKSDLNFEKDVPPDLTIEINRTSSSVPRMPIFAAFGIKEVWRFAAEKVKFYTLENKVYLETETSIALPILSSKQATEFLRASREMKSTDWTKKIRRWVNDQK